MCDGDILNDNAILFYLPSMILTLIPKMGTGGIWTGLNGLQDSAKPATHPGRQHLPIPIPCWFTVRSLFLQLLPANE